MNQNILKLSLFAAMQTQRLAIMQTIIALAGQTGVEPATFGFGDRCSTN